MDSGRSDFPSHNYPLDFAPLDVVFQVIAVLIFEILKNILSLLYPINFPPPIVVFSSNGPMPRYNSNPHKLWGYLPHCSPVYCLLNGAEKHHCRRRSDSRGKKGSEAFSPPDPCTIFSSFHSFVVPLVPKTRKPQCKRPKRP